MRPGAGPFAAVRRLAGTRAARDGAAVFAVALAARALFLALAGSPLAGDSRLYLKLATNLLRHGAFSLDEAPPYAPTIHYPPGYPFFLACLGALGIDSPAGLALAQAPLDAATAVLVLVLARRVVPPRWALAAALFYALHPGPIPYASVLLSEALFTFLLCGAAVLAGAGVERDRARATAAGGLVLGLAAVTRSIALPLPVLGACAVLAAGRPRRLTHAALLGGCAALVIVPWCVRSSLLAGLFVPVQARSVINVYAPSRKVEFFRDQRRGQGLVAGPGAGAGQTSGTAPVQTAASGAPAGSGTPDPYWSRISTATSPVEMAEADRLGLGLALRNIAADPGGYVASRARVLPHLFIYSFDRFTGIDRPFGELLGGRDVALLGVKLALLAIFSLLPFALALAGLAVTRGSIGAAVCAGVWLYTLVIHVPLWIEYRFWLPALPFLCVSAALGARASWRRLHAEA